LLAEWNMKINACHNVAKITSNLKMGSFDSLKMYFFYFYVCF